MQSSRDPKAAPAAPSDLNPLSPSPRASQEGGEPYHEGVEVPGGAHVGGEPLRTVPEDAAMTMRRCAPHLPDRPPPAPPRTTLRPVRAVAPPAAARPRAAHMPQHA